MQLFNKKNMDDDNELYENGQVSVFFSDDSLSCNHGTSIISRNAKTEYSHRNVFSNDSIRNIMQRTSLRKDKDTLIKTFVIQNEKQENERVMNRGNHELNKIKRR